MDELTDIIYKGTDLSSIRILGMIENSEPVSATALIRSSYKLGTMSTRNVKIDLAIKHGAITEKCPQFNEIDFIVKRQLYSRDMAGNTTSVFTHDATSLNGLLKTTVSDTDKNLYNEYRTALKMYNLHLAVKWNIQQYDHDIRTLFHLRKTSS